MNQNQVSAPLVEIETQEGELVEATPNDLAGQAIAGKVYTYASTWCLDPQGSSIYKKDKTRRSYKRRGKTRSNTYYDRCSGSNQVKEYSCTYKRGRRGRPYDYKLKIENKQCEFGCSNGACIDLKDTSKYTDGQVISSSAYWMRKGCKSKIGEKDFYKKESTSYRKRWRTQSISDKCLNNQLLTEYSCKDSKRRLSETVFCENGCKDGACVQVPAASNQRAAKKFFRPRVTGIEIYPRTTESMKYYIANTGQNQANEYCVLRGYKLAVDWSTELQCKNLHQATYESQDRWFARANNQKRNMCFDSITCGDDASAKLEKVPEPRQNTPQIIDERFSDSDGGKNYNVKGFVTFDGKEFHDTCVEDSSYRYANQVKNHYNERNLGSFFNKVETCTNCKIAEAVTDKLKEQLDAYRGGTITKANGAIYYVDNVDSCHQGAKVN